MSNLNYDLATIKSFIDLAAESLENQKKYLKNIHDKDLQQWVSYESNVCLVEAAISYLRTAIKLIQNCQTRQELSLIGENKDRTTVPEGSGSISTEEFMEEMGWLPKTPTSLTPEKIKELSDEGLDLSEELRERIKKMHCIPIKERLAKS